VRVFELIAALEEFPGNAIVFGPGHPDGGGYDEINYVDKVKTKSNGYYCSYAGDWSYAEEGEEGEEGVFLR